MLVKVALPLPISALTYSVPEELVASIKVGTPVDIELRRKTQTGYIVELNAPKDGDYAVKEIRGISQNLPELSQEHLELLLWLANYYHYPIGEVIESALPPKAEEEKISLYSLSQPLGKISDDLQKKLKQRGGKRWELLSHLEEHAPTAEIPQELRSMIAPLLKLGLIRAEEKNRSDLIGLDAAKYHDTAPALHEAQTKALATLRAALDKKTFQPFLLEGVTGSGKTEIYLHAAEQVLREGGGVLILVPEISLTPQLFSRFQARLHESIAILHSGLTDRERSRQWHLLNSGKVRIAVGARSTILAPIKNLRLVVVDEEHEGAFKQEDRMRYNARDVAILRAKKNNAVVLLGSATPSLESFHNVLNGKYGHIRLESRVTANPLPEVEIIDQKQVKMFGMISSHLKRAIESALVQKKQTMLLLNRRGFASYLSCDNCGFVPECKNCSVTLTYYSHKKELRCHYCGYFEKPKNACEKCDSADMTFGTLGTEALEANVRELFPGARAIRIDRESIKNSQDLEAALLSIAKEEVDIIIGTQMIAKGHDFPNVTLVGVINADASINFPDFRSGERSFQLFTQMAGRAGRGDFSGKVLIQCYHAEHPSIRLAAQHDFRAFAEQELKARLAFHYPPYYKIARILVTDTKPEQAEKIAQAISKDLLSILPSDINLLGPAPSMIQKLQNRYRWSILLKAKESSAINAALKTVLAHWQSKIAHTTSLSVDVDPSSLI